MSDLKGRSIASSYKNLIQSSSEISNTNLKQIESGSGNKLAMKLSTDKAIFTKVGIGNTGSAPDGLLHIMATSVGDITAANEANDLILESHTDTGLSIFSGRYYNGNIYFGDTQNSKMGRISYDHQIDAFQFWTNGSHAMTLDKNSNLRVNGSISQSEDRYTLREYFHTLPYKDVQDSEITQSSSATDAVTSHTKNTRITTVANDLAANDSQEFTFNNTMIHTKSYVHAVLVDTSATVGDNAAVVVMAYDIANGNCKIRISNANVDISSMTFTIQVTVDAHIHANSHWALKGTNCDETKVRYAGTQPGIMIYTSGGDNDQMILQSKKGNEGNNTDLVNTSPWRNVNFHSQFQTELDVGITTFSDITNTAIWVGMKLTTTGAYATDADQAYFLYATDDDMGALTTNGNLHFIYSIGGVDYITDLGITVTANTVYKLRFFFDENRQIRVFVNNQQYGLVNIPTTTTAGGLTTTSPTSRSLIVPSSTALQPVVAVQALSADPKYLYVHFVKISRTLE